MQIENKLDSLFVKRTEAVNPGMGTIKGLLQTAVQESMARGFGGRLTMSAVDQRVLELAIKLGGEVSDDTTNAIFFSEEAAKKLLE